MIEEFLSLIFNVIFFIAIFIAIMWITGFIGSLASSISAEDEEEKETFLIYAWAVTCFALTIFVCSLIFGG